MNCCDSIKAFIAITGEYGKPSDKFMDNFIQDVYFGKCGYSYDIDMSNTAELDETYKKSRAAWRGGAKFYIDMALANIVTEEQAKDFVMGYKCEEEVETMEKEKFNWDYQSLVVSPPKIRGVNYEKIYRVALNTKALMLEGAPGTGKTAILRRLAYDISDGDANRNMIMSFNSGIEYEDFISGVQLVNGNTVICDGVFTEFCKRASLNRGYKFCFAIDESSRANAAKVFGEAFSCIEYRDRVIKLRNGEDFAIPSNVYLVATMNTTDASVVHTDNALFDRWAHMELDPQWNMEFMGELIKACPEAKYVLENVTECMAEFNTVVKGSLGAGNMIGLRSMSIEHVTMGNIKEAIEYKLVPSMKHVASRALRIDTKEELDDIVSKVEELLRYEV